MAESDIKTFTKMISKIQEDSFSVFEAKVNSVDESTYTCEIETETFKIGNVPLRLYNADNDKGIIIIPKVDSRILVIGRKNNIRTSVIEYTEIDKVIININDGATKIVCQDGNVSITSDKIYLNTDSEDEPITRASKTKTHIDKLYDLVNDLYSQILVPHTGNMGAPTVVSPTVIANSTIKQGEITTQKGILDEIKSTSNFTE